MEKKISDNILEPEYHVLTSKDIIKIDLRLRASGLLDMPLVQQLITLMEEVSPKSSILINKDGVTFRI